eukprot:3381603-Amphidinium_carterae.3
MPAGQQREAGRAMTARLHCDCLHVVFEAWLCSPAQYDMGRTPPILTRRIPMSGFRAPELQEYFGLQAVCFDGIGSKYDETRMPNDKLKFSCCPLQRHNWEKHRA